MVTILVLKNKMNLQYIVLFVKVKFYINIICCYSTIHKKPLKQENVRLFNFK